MREMVETETRDKGVPHARQPAAASPYVPPIDVSPPEPGAGTSSSSYSS